MIPTLLIISIISFIIIELPPGDIVTTRLAQMTRQKVSQELIENLRHRYGLDRPVYVRYFIWISNFVRGDFGYSLYWNKPVKDLILSRFALTALISLLSLFFTWVMAFPIAIYSAVRQYSLADFFWTVVGFLGLAIPNFLLALVLMVLSYKYFPNLGIGGLFSSQFQGAAWSWGKFVNLLGHLWVPVVVIGTAGTAGLIRIVRANLLDELKKAYVQTARAKGVSEVRLILKYPVRMAINPFFSTVGWVLPSLIAGETITAVVLGLPTAGPLFLQALRAQDMQLAGAFVMLCAILTIMGTLISDILLVVVDPRIRYE
jgi:peptide/nickel transport system permease protein